MNQDIYVLVIYNFIHNSVERISLFSSLRRAKEVAEYFSNSDLTWNTFFEDSQALFTAEVAGDSQYNYKITLRRIID